jgi:hypothetical protein
MKTNFVREPVRVLMHLNGDYTKVIVERTEGRGLVDGGIEWEIPTAKIPQHLRSIGSRFIVNSEAIWPEETDTIESLKEACSRIEIEELV